MKSRYIPGSLAGGITQRTDVTVPRTAATRVGAIFSAALCTIFTAVLWGMALYGATSASPAAAQPEAVSITEDPGPAPVEELAERRARILDGMGSGIMILFGA